MNLRRMMTFRPISPSRSKSRTAILIVVSAFCSAACTSEIYPGSDMLPEYFAEEKERLTSFIDALQAETGMTEVWCVPPGTIIGQRRSEVEEFELSGDLSNTFKLHCIETQAAGAVIEPDGEAVVLEPTQNGSRYFRIDILRLNEAKNREPACGWISYFRSVPTCDIQLDERWVARYRWNDSNDIEKLYE